MRIADWLLVAQVANSRLGKISFLPGSKDPNGGVIASGIDDGPDLPFAATQRWVCFGGNSGPEMLTASLRILT